MRKGALILRVAHLMLRAAAVIVAGVILTGGAAAQSRSLHEGADDKGMPAKVEPARQVEGADPYFKDIYRSFYENYRLGPADELAIRVVGQPDYTVEKAQVSPFGRLYHPLIGEVEVGGLTLSKAAEKLTIEFSQYIRDPRVSLSLVSANSSMIGVLGDVPNPGIVVMSRPMTVVDAITASGGVTDLGSQSNVTLVRRGGDGTMRTSKVNVKRILEGKAGPEENVALQAGDTLIVHGNTKKKIGLMMSTFGFGRFIDFLSRR